MKENRPLAKVHIAAFHHPMDCKKPSDVKNLLKGRDQAIELFEKYGVDLIVGGHIHDPFVTSSKTRYPNVNRSMVITVAGTCLSWRTRPGAPNSFNLIEVDTTADLPRMNITRYDHKDDFSFSVKETFNFRKTTDLGWIV